MRLRFLLPALMLAVSLSVGARPTHAARAPTCSRFSDTLLGGHQNQAPAPKVVNVVAERFQFFPSEITVDEGTVVELRIRSEDTSHGFRLIGPGEIDVEIPKRGRGDIRVTFDAMEPGTYQFECSRVCGAGHSFMRGTLRVRSRTTAK